MSANVSVSNLTQQCLDKFHEAMSGKNVTENQYHLESRLAGFNLWVDNVGALAKSGASLDSRFRSRPDDLDLVKNILSLLSDFLDEYIDTIQKGLSIEESMVNIDSAIRNLAKIGVAIRRTGNASRSRRAYQSFNPDEHHEFKQHLNCLILLRPNENSSINELIDAASDESSEKIDVLKTKLEQLTESRMEDPASSKLNEIQKRLVNANLRRRHNFLLAQKRSQRVKKTAQTEFTPDKHQPDIALRRGTEISLKAKAMDQTKMPASLEPENQPTRRKAAPTVTGHTIASTAEGTLQFNLAKIQHRAPTISPSQISFIAANTEFPRPPPSFQNQLVFKCPCCCQSLPSEDFTSPSRWRQHLIEDLCPYTCIAQSCPTPDKLFTTRKAWELHVENDHPPQWQCLLCDEDDVPFSSEEDITTHTLTQHEQELSKYELSFLVSSAEVRYMGIDSCPLCSSHGPRDSTELVDHAVRHAYEFALRALPWPQYVKENLNKPIGTFSLPEDASNSEQLEKWLDNLEESAKELSISSFDKMDHSLPEEDGDTLEEDYFANNGYFEDREMADFSKRQTAQGRSSIVWSESSGPDLSNQDDVNDPTQAEMDFSAAVSRGDEDAVRSMIEDCQTFDSGGNIRKRALMAAVQGGNIAIVKQLLRSGIDIDSEDEYGRTALFFAVERNDIPMVRHLIESGSDVDNKDHENLTPLQRIIQRGDEKNISALFTPEIYHRFTDDQSQTLLTWAENKGHIFAAQVLTKLREKHESMLSHAQETFNIEDRAAAAQTVIPGNDWYALIDPALEPLYFDLMNTLPHEYTVNKLAFSHNGKYIATGDNKGIVRIFGVETLQEVFQGDLGTNEYIRDICFSPDGRFLATTSDKLIKVFDINMKTVQHTFMHDATVRALDISYDGRLLASGDSDGTVRILDMDQGVEVKKFTARKKISGVKIDPDSHFVAASCFNCGDVYIWDLKTDALKERISDDRDDVTSTFFSSDGKHIAASNYRSIKLWDQDTGKCLSFLAVNPRQPVLSVFLTPDNRWIAAGQIGGSVRFWDWTTEKCHYLVHKRRLEPCMAVSPLGGCFATAFDYKTVYIWSYGPRRQT